MLDVIGYAAKTPKSKLKPYEFKRKNLRPDQVLVGIKYCGICHSDVHQVKNEWKNTLYPCMPGHEIVGVVEKIGKNVKRFKVGETVGIGCMIDSCNNCEPCKKGEEQLCERGATATYNGNIREPKPDQNTFGGYSNKIIAKDKFVLKIPEGLAPEAVAPLLCAGITTYSPLRHWKVGKGTKVGVVGIGGLGHIAIKLAKAMGAEVTAITGTKSKTKDARALGAKHVILSTDKKAMEDAEESLDFILSTIPQSHDVNPYLTLLKSDGVLSIVGCLVPLKKPLDMTKMIMNRRTISTSIIGGIPETQEVLEFCAKHNILPDTKLISIDKVNKAFKDVHKGDIDFRYVIDMSSLKNKHELKGPLQLVGYTPKAKRVPH